MVKKMEENDKHSEGEFWKQKIRKHWKIFTASIISGAVAIVASIVVLFWFIDTSPIGAMGTATIGEWTLAWIWEFFIFLTLWELLIVGIPVAIVLGGSLYLWWKRLPEEDKVGFKGKGRGRGTAESGGFSFGMFIAYSIYMYINGYFYTPFGDHPYTFWVYAWFHTLAWLFVIIGIPAAIILIVVYFVVWSKKEAKEKIV
jgi:MFS family permease